MPYNVPRVSFLILERLNSRQSKTSEKSKEKHRDRAVFQLGEYYVDCRTLGRNRWPKWAEIETICHYIKFKFNEAKQI